jgi:hypothetical protein
VARPPGGVSFANGKNADLVYRLCPLLFLPPAWRARRRWPTMSGTAVPTLLDFFGQLPKGAQATLFKDPWTCQAILRALSPLGQQYALRLASAQGPLPAALVEVWVQPTREARTKHDLAISQLSSLGLLQPRARGGCATSAPFELHSEFGAQLLLVLRGGDAVANVTDVREDEHKPTLAQLEAHAKRTWEMVLQAVITPPQNPVPLRRSGPNLELAGSSLQALLCKAGLLDAVGAAVQGAGRTSYQVSYGAAPSPNPSANRYPSPNPNSNRNPNPKLNPNLNPNPSPNPNPNPIPDGERRETLPDAAGARAGVRHVACSLQHVACSLQHVACSL